MKTFASLMERKMLITNFGYQKIPSPIFDLTGKVPEGADLLKVQWRNGGTKEEFPIAMEDWKEFALTFRMGYGNIEAGVNKYQLSFWEGAQLRGLGILYLETHFEEKKFGDAVLYIDEKAGTLRDE